MPQFHRSRDPTRRAIGDRIWPAKSLAMEPSHLRRHQTLLQVPHSIDWNPTWTFQASKVMFWKGYFPLNSHIFFFMFFWAGFNKICFFPTWTSYTSSTKVVSKETPQSHQQRWQQCSFQWTSSVPRLGCFPTFLSTEVELVKSFVVHRYEGLWRCKTCKVD